MRVRSTWAAGARRAVSSCHTAFIKRTPTDRHVGGSLLRVRTRAASDLPRVIATAKRRFGDADVFSFENLAIEGQGAQNAIDVATVGLYLAAGSPR